MPAPLATLYGHAPVTIRPLADTGTATSGNAWSLTKSTAAWVVNKFAGMRVHITAGTGINQKRTIVRNTATILYVSPDFTTAPDATSVFDIRVVDDFKYPASIGRPPIEDWADIVNAALEHFHGTTLRDLNPKASGTVAAATTTTLQSSGTPGWTVNRFAGDYVVILSGKGAGQRRLIASNTADTLTITSAWNIIPSGTGAPDQSSFQVEWDIPAFLGGGPKFIPNLKTGANLLHPQFALTYDNTGANAVFDDAVNMSLPWALQGITNAGFIVKMQWI